MNVKMFIDIFCFAFLKEISIFIVLWGSNIGLVCMTYGYEAMIKSYVSPHRATSLDAVVFGINELKKKVPICKKEIYKG